MGEVITLKICALLLHTGREVEAVGWFRNYVEWFRSRVGPQEGTFLHWNWMSRQYEVFGELLYQRLLVTGQIGDSSREGDPGTTGGTLQSPSPAVMGASAAGGSSASGELSGPSGLFLLPAVRRHRLPHKRGLLLYNPWFNDLVTLKLISRI